MEYYNPYLPVIDQHFWAVVAVAVLLLYVALSVWYHHG